MTNCERCHAHVFGRSRLCVECRAADLRVSETARESQRIDTRAAQMTETCPTPAAEPPHRVVGTMRLLHEIVVAGKRLRIERAPSGLNHYFVNDRDVGIEAYFAVTATVHAAADQAVRLVRSA